MDALLEAQRERVVGEFSLDRQDSALARLLTELRTHHGRVAGEFKDSMASIVSEFSLDKADSALSRLGAVRDCVGICVTQSPVRVTLSNQAATSSG